jgi:hypothetical protein
MGRRAEFDHVLHEIGRMECAAAGCEPKMVEHMVPPYEVELRAQAKKEGGRALIGGNRQARAIAHRKLEKKDR